jgi:hypothetical protein
MKIRTEQRCKGVKAVNHGTVWFLFSHARLQADDARVRGSGLRHAVSQHQSSQRSGLCGKGFHPTVWRGFGSVVSTRFNVVPQGYQKERLVEVFVRRRRLISHFLFMCVLISGFCANLSGYALLPIRCKSSISRGRMGMASASVKVLHSDMECV